ncbi:Calcium/calmodulin-dependent 3',5'-cyclic nucleotide phosphodiesterase 1B, partial [Perkinsus chesapeaki]
DITFGQNTYTSLFVYKKPTGSLTATSTVFENFCGPSVPAFNSLSEISTTRLWDGRLPKTSLCFPACKGKGYDAAQSIALDLSSTLNQDEIEAQLNSSSLLSVGEQLTMALYSSSGDSRPYCSDQEIDLEEDDLLCVDPQDDCETESFSDEICYSGGHQDTGAICIPWGRIFLAILYSAPVQFILDLLLLMIVLGDNRSRSVTAEDDLSDSAVVAASRKCTIQWLLLTAVIALVLIVSRIRAALFVPRILVNCIPIRPTSQHCIASSNLLGKVQAADYRRLSDADGESDDGKGKEELSPWQLLRSLTILVVESQGFEYFVYSLVGVYALFILSSLGIEDYVSAGVNNVFEAIDTVFLGLFLLEIVLRLIAEGLWYLYDRWNLFDFVIVVGSCVAKIAAPGDAQSFTILRLFRLLRLVLALRKAGSKKKARGGQQSDSTALQFSSRVDRVVDILREVKESKGVSAAMREKMDWASEIISTNKLYTISVSAGKGGTDEDGDDELGAIRSEINDWLALASATAKTSTKTWRDDELENFLAKKRAASLADTNAENASKASHSQTRTANLLGSILAGSELITDHPDNGQINRINLDPGATRVIGYLAKSATMWSFNIFTLRYLLGHPNNIPDPEAYDASYAPELDPRLKSPAEVLASPKAAQNRRGSVLNVVASGARRSIRGSITGGGTTTSNPALTARLTSLGHDVMTGTLYRTFNKNAALGFFDDSDLSELPLLSCAGMYFFSVVSAFGDDYGPVGQLLPSESPRNYKQHVVSDRSVKLDLVATAEFLRKVEKGYLPRNPYHNSMHSVDVMQAMLTFLVCIQLGSASPQLFSAQEVQAGLLAAAIHDYQHPGVDNGFLTSSHHPIAIRYSDNSILENHHVASVFTLLNKMPVNPLTGYSEEDWALSRKMIIEMVLMTDNQNHFTTLSELRAKLKNCSSSFPGHKSDLSDRQLLLNILLHAADLSNPSRDIECYLLWAPRVMEEFSRQGDLERERGMPLSPMHDRTNVNTPKCQTGFIDVLVLPLYQVLSQIMPDLINGECLPNLQLSRQYYATRPGAAVDVAGGGRASIVRRLSLLKSGNTTKALGEIVTSPDSGSPKSRDNPERENDVSSVSRKVSQSLMKLMTTARGLFGIASRVRQESGRSQEMSEEMPI